MEDTAKIRLQEIIGLLRREYGNLTGNERQEVADRIEALTADNERLQARVAELEEAVREKAHRRKVPTWARFNKGMVVAAHLDNPDWTARQIADSIGCSPAYVRATARRNGLHIPRVRHPEGGRP